VRRREFYYSWCDLTEVDYVCTVCETIVLVPALGCQYCRGQEEKARLRLQKLKEGKHEKSNT